MPVSESTLLEALRAVVDPNTGSDFVITKQLKNLRIDTRVSTTGKISSRTLASRTDWLPSLPVLQWGRGAPPALPACVLDARSHRRREHIHVDVAERLELDAIARHTRLAEFLSIGRGQVFLVFDSKDIDRNARRVRAEADLIELRKLSKSIKLNRMKSVDKSVCFIFLL